MATLQRIQCVQFFICKVTLHKMQKPNSKMIAIQICSLFFAVFFMMIGPGGTGEDVFKCYIADEGDSVIIHDSGRHENRLTQEAMVCSSNTTQCASYVFAAKFGYDTRREERKKLREKRKKEPSFSVRECWNYTSTDEECEKIVTQLYQFDHEGRRYVKIRAKCIVCNTSMCNSEMPSLPPPEQDDGTWFPGTGYEPWFPGLDPKDYIKPWEFPPPEPLPREDFKFSSAVRTQSNCRIICISLLICYVNIF